MPNEIKVDMQFEAGFIQICMGVFSPVFQSAKAPISKGILRIPVYRGINTVRDWMISRVILMTRLEAV